MTTLRPYITSKWVVDTIEDNSNGYVHSVFNTGINIKMGTNLIFIGERIVPFGICVNKKVDYKNLEVNEKVECLNKILFINKYSIDLNNAELYDYKLSGEIEDSQYSLFMDYCITNNSFTGLNRTILDLAVDFSSLIKNDDSYYSFIKYCMGKGIGLTPSGDDLIVGYLYSQFLFKSVNEKLLSAISKVFSEVDTTSVSKQYLEFATKGQFSEEIIYLNNALCSNSTDLNLAIEKILSVGHTSGIDTMAGIYLGFSLKEINK